MNQKLDRKDIENLVRSQIEKLNIEAGQASEKLNADAGRVPAKQYIVAANWKMNMSAKETKSFLEKMKEDSIPAHLKPIIFPPYPYLNIFQQMLRYDRIAYGAQDVAKEENGAYTGEVSADMLTDMGCTYVLAGHSERRTYYGDTPELVAEKTAAALSRNLVPVVCIGETLSERKNGLFKPVLKSQLDPVAKKVGPALSSCIVAYEPVWAIGTGVIPTMTEIAQTHAYVHELLASYGCGGVKILYGGSVKPDNVREIASVEHVDGFLIGGASLKVDSYKKIISLLNVD